jgi:hypothetical protein
LLENSFALNLKAYPGFSSRVIPIPLTETVTDLLTPPDETVKVVESLSCKGV